MYIYCILCTHTVYYVHILYGMYIYCMLCIQSVYEPMLMYILYSIYTICTLFHYLLCIHIILYKLYVYMICNSVYFVLYVTYCTLCIYISLNLIYIKSTYDFFAYILIYFFWHVFDKYCSRTTINNYNINSISNLSIYQGFLLMQVLHAHRWFHLENMQYKVPLLERPPIILCLRLLQKFLLP